MGETTMNYTVGSGYHPGIDPRGINREEFFHLWHANVTANSKPEQIIVIGDSGAVIPKLPGITPVELRGDLGHIGDALNGTKNYEFVGWSTSVMALALLCYANETDFVFVEQDVLMFGGCIEKMYEEIGEASVIFGKSGLMSCAQSLFLVRHAYLPMFVHQYLSLGTDTRVGHLGEDHFTAASKCWPEDWRQFNFGVDRDRPDGWIDQRPLYVQQLTAGEMAAMKEKGMI
jgi:hypothetical protein